MAWLGKISALAVVVVSTASAFVTIPLQLRSSNTADCTITCARNRIELGASRPPCSRPLARHPLAAALQGSTSEDSSTYELDGKSIRGPLQPVEDTILVKVDGTKETTAAGVFLPHTKAGGPTRGTVQATGPGKRHWDTGVQIPIKVNVGDRVAYGNYDGTSVQYQGSQHLLMRDDEILMSYSDEEINLDTVRMPGDRVLVKIKVTPTGSSASAGGILIPKSTERSDLPTVGLVEKVGPGRMVPSGKIMPMYVKPGDRIKYKDFAAERVSIAGMETETEKFVVIRNIDILVKW